MTEQTELTAARIAKGSIYLTLQNISSTLIGVLGLAFMVRMITQEEMGAIAGITLLTGLVQLISDFGLNASITKHVSEMRGRGENISGVVVSAIAFRIPICLLLSSTLFVLAPNISAILFKTPIYAYAIRLLSIDAVILSLSPLLNNVLWGAGELKNMAVYGTISVAIRWLSITAFLITNKGINSIILGWITGDVALLLVLTFSVARFANFQKQTFQTMAKQISALLKFASPLYLASAVSFLYAWYDQALILAYLPLSDLGIYNVTYMAFSVLAIFATALGSALLPYYGMVHGRNDHQAISLGIKRASKYTMLTIFPLTLGLLSTSKPILTLFAGQQYETGWTILAILSLFGLTYGVAPAFSNLLLIYGKTKTILLLSLVPVVSSLVLLPLIWILGLTGLAIMRGVSLTLSFILTVYFINKTIKIQIDKTTLTKTLMASTMMAAVILILQQIIYDKTILPFYILIGATIYIAINKALKTLNQEDFQLLRQIMGEKAAKYAMKIVGPPAH